MGLTVLPTKIDTSIGRPKSDRTPDGAPPPDLDFDAPALEFERMKQAIVDNAAAIGLGDGSTSGSLEARVGTPIGATRYRHVDDFTSLRASAADGPNETVLAVNGTATTPNAAFEPQITQGFGWVNLVVPNSAGASARIQFRVDLIHGGQNPIFRGRIRLPATLADATPLVGLADAGDFSYARLFVNTGGFWVTSVKSSNGGSNNDTVTAVAAVAAATYDVRIEVTGATQARFFIQEVGQSEVDLGTENTVDTIPDALDTLGNFAQIDRVAGIGTLSIDWWDVEGDR